MTDARWTFRWDVDGSVVDDTWTDRVATCARSAADAENARALVHRSHVAVCDRRCARGAEADWGPCWLRCEAVVTLRDRRCTERRRVLPRPPFWIR